MTKTRFGIKPGFVKVGKKKMVIMEEREYDRLLDIVDAAEAKRILGDPKLKILPWEEVREKVVGSQIAEMRKSLKITQKELAKRMRVKQSTISRIEKPDANLTLATLQKLAGIFGCSVHQILRGV